MFCKVLYYSYLCTRNETKSKIMNHTKEHTHASLIHLSALLGYLFPFGAILFPLILWKANKPQTNIITTSGKSAVNFNLSYTLYKVILFGILIVVFFGFEFHKNLLEIFLFLGIYVSFELATVCIVFIAAAKIHRGESFEYPCSINFIK